MGHFELHSGGASQKGTGVGTVLQGSVPSSWEGQW